MKKLWEKDWTLEETIEAFETGVDLGLDQKLAEFDVCCSLAHAKMLNRIGIISGKELDDIKKGLKEILALLKEDKFILKAGDEDIHTKIENFVTEKYNGAGKKMHTGRSRNDQVLTDIRLYTKNNLLHIWEELLRLAEQFYKFSKAYEFLPMPGYTHMQKAMPSSLGLWSSAFIEALLDDLHLLKSVYLMNDKSPLGTAASYGVPLPLDREYTAKLLGFRNLQKNSLYAQNSRGKIESAVISALNVILFDINRFASDVMLFGSSEFGYFEIDERLCSGSSIMPQKKNIDVAELLRSKMHLGIGYYVETLGLAGNLVSGYNRDLQDGKKPLMEGLEITLDSIRVAAILLDNIKPNKEKMRTALTPEIYATHKALEMVASGVPFRTAHGAVGKDPSYNVNDIERLLKKSRHIGGTGNLSLGGYHSEIQNEHKNLVKEERNFSVAIQNLLKGE